MLNYYVASIISGQTTRFWTLCDASLSGAIIAAQRQCDETSTVINVEHCEDPAITLILDNDKISQPPASIKGHLMTGGALELGFRGELYLVQPTLFSESVFEGEGDDQREIVGTCVIKKVTGTPDEISFELEEIDHSHVVDRLKGVFFSFAIEHHYRNS